MYFIFSNIFFFFFFFFWIELNWMIYYYYFVAINMDFQKHSQEDAHEFLECLFDKIQNKFVDKYNEKRKADGLKYFMSWLNFLRLSSIFLNHFLVSNLDFALFFLSNGMFFIFNISVDQFHCAVMKQLFYQEYFLVF